VLAIFIGYEVPAGDGKPASFRSAGTHELPLPHSMVVNAAGRRFGDEAFFHKVLNALRDSTSRRTGSRTYRVTSFFRALSSRSTALAAPAPARFPRRNVDDT
jgi:hypothetical protein